MTLRVQVKYGYDHPRFRAGSWAKFYEDNIRWKDKLFVVNLHDEDDSDDAFFCRFCETSLALTFSLVLARKEVSQFFSTTALPLWVGSVSSDLRDVRIS